MMSLFSNLKGFMSPSKPSSANGDNHLNNEDKMSRGQKRKADPYDVVPDEEGWSSFTHSIHTPKSRLAGRPQMQQPAICRATINTTAAHH